MKIVNRSKHRPPRRDLDTSRLPEEHGQFTAVIILLELRTSEQTLLMRIFEVLIATATLISCVLPLLR